MCVAPPKLSRRPRNAKSANPQATITYDGVRLREADQFTNFCPQSCNSSTKLKSTKYTNSTASGAQNNLQTLLKDIWQCLESGRTPDLSLMTRAHILGLQQ